MRRLLMLLASLGYEVTDRETGQVLNPVSHEPEATLDMDEDEDFVPDYTPPVPESEPKPEPERVLYCSFCDKNHHEVFKLIAGPGVFICDECVDLCAEIVEEVRAAERKKKLDEALAKRPRTEADPSSVIHSPSKL